MSDEIHDKLPADSYKDYVTVEGGARLIDLFPNGIEFILRGNEVELLTEPVGFAAKVSSDAKVEKLMQKSFQNR